ncbi:MAG: hypothetical protein ABI277_05160, partial [Burkholderiaceae bacterium]
RLPATGAGPASALLVGFPTDGVGSTLAAMVERDADGKHTAALAMTRKLTALAQRLSTDIALRYFSIVGDLWRTTAR